LRLHRHQRKDIERRGESRRDAEEKEIIGVTTEGKKEIRTAFLAGNFICPQQEGFRKKGLRDGERRDDRTKNMLMILPAGRGVVRKYPGPGRGCASDTARRRGDKKRIGHDSFFEGDPALRTYFKEPKRKWKKKRGNRLLKGAQGENRTTTT